MAGSSSGTCLDNTLQDILTRWKRMQGYNVLWLPGNRPCYIATQAKVEEALAQEGLAATWDGKSL